MLTNTKFVERRYHVRPVMMKGEDATAFLLWYSSLLGQCLRLLSYATGALPHLRLRAFGPRPSLPPLCFGAAGRPYPALRRKSPAANHHGVGRVRRCSFTSYSFMVSVEINGSKRLLVFSAAGHVSREEVKQAAEEVRNALQDVAPGLRALIDFRWLESMRPSAASHIAEIMDALAEKQVASVIRIIPDPGKDIGLNILSQFHYARELPITTVETLVEALDRLTEQNAELAERN